MDTKRGAIVVGASLAALTAGFFLRRWWITKQNMEEQESADLVEKFDAKMERANATKRRAKRSTNGRAKIAAN